MTPSPAIPLPPERGVAWQFIDPGSRPGVNVPEAGEDGRAAFDTRENRLIFFGGKNDYDMTVADTWFYYPQSNRWEKLTASELSPPPREDHVLVYDPLRHKAIMHGGEDGDTSNQLWELDLNTLQWEDKTDSTSPYLEDHYALYVPETHGMYVFGGQNEQFPVLADLWFLNLDLQSPEYYRWKKIQPEGEKHPPGRVDHCMAYDPYKKRLLLFGGWNKGKDYFTTDTWDYSIAANQWKRITPRDRHHYPPSRRHFAAAVDLQNKMWVIFGGRGEGSMINDIWAFDMVRDVWIDLTPGPAPRLDHTLFYDPSSGEIYLYGGDEGLPGQSGKLHDLWKIKLPAPPQPAAEASEKK